MTGFPIQGRLREPSRNRHAGFVFNGPRKALQRFRSGEYRLLLLLISQQGEGFHHHWVHFGSARVYEDGEGLGVGLAVAVGAVRRPEIARSWLNAVLRVTLGPKL